jgi:hypothetical protein
MKEKIQDITGFEPGNFQKLLLSTLIEELAFKDSAHQHNNSCLHTIVFF